MIAVGQVVHHDPPLLLLTVLLPDVYDLERPHGCPGERILVVCIDPEREETDGIVARQLIAKQRPARAGGNLIELEVARRARRRALDLRGLSPALAAIEAEEHLDQVALASRSNLRSESYV